MAFLHGERESFPILRRESADACISSADKRCDRAPSCRDIHANFRMDSRCARAHIHQTGVLDADSAGKDISCRVESACKVMTPVKGDTGEFLLHGHFAEIFRPVERGIRMHDRNTGAGMIGMIEIDTSRQIVVASAPVSRTVIAA